MTFYLEKVENGYSDIDCPYCSSSYDIKWDTEYGYAEDGVHEIDCPFCGRIFQMQVSTQTFYEVDEVDYHD
jgi:uncharacterized Zn-finger protein